MSCTFSLSEPSHSGFGIRSARPELARSSERSRLVWSRRERTNVFSSDPPQHAKRARSGLVSGSACNLPVWNEHVHALVAGTPVHHERQFAMPFQLTTKLDGFVPDDH